MKRVYTLLLSLFAFCINIISSQEVIKHQFSLNWSETELLEFDGSGQFSGDPRLPIYTYRFPIQSNSAISTSLTVGTSIPVSLIQFQPAIDLPRNPILGATTEMERGKWYARLWLVPIIAGTGNEAQKILTGEITLQLNNKPGSVNRSGPNFKETSVLSDGIIHKIRIEKTGIYKIDYSFVKDKIKIDPATISPSRFAVYGNGSGRIPQANNEFRIDDLEETYMTAVGMEDGKFDQSDYFLLYAEGADRWTYVSQERI